MAFDAFETAVTSLQRGFDDLGSGMEKYRKNKGMAEQAKIIDAAMKTPEGQAKMASQWQNPEAARAAFAAGDENAWSQQMPVPASMQSMLTLAGRVAGQNMNNPEAVKIYRDALDKYAAFTAINDRVQYGVANIHEKGAWDRALLNANVEMAKNNAKDKNLKKPTSQVKTLVGNLGLEKALTVIDNGIRGAQAKGVAKGGLQGLTDIYGTTIDKAAEELLKGDEKVRQFSDGSYPPELNMHNAKAITAQVLTAKLYSPGKTTADILNEFASGKMAVQGVLMPETENELTAVMNSLKATDIDPSAVDTVRGTLRTTKEQQAKLDSIMSSPALSDAQKVQQYNATLKTFQDTAGKEDKPLTRDAATNPLGTGSVLSGEETIPDEQGVNAKKIEELTQQAFSDPTAPMQGKIDKSSPVETKYNEAIAAVPESQPLLSGLFSIVGKKDLERLSVYAEQVKKVTSDMNSSFDELFDMIASDRNRGLLTRDQFKQAQSMLEDMEDEVTVRMRREAVAKAAMEEKHGMLSRGMQ